MEVRSRQTRKEIYIVADSFRFFFVNPHDEIHTQSQCSNRKQRKWQNNFMHIEHPPEDIQHKSTLQTKNRKISGRNIQSSGINSIVGLSPQSPISSRSAKSKGPEGCALLRAHTMSSAGHTQSVILSQADRSHRSPACSRSVKSKGEKVAPCCEHTICHQ